MLDNLTGYLASQTARTLPMVCLYGRLSAHHATSQSL